MSVGVTRFHSGCGQQQPKYTCSRAASRQSGSTCGCDQVWFSFTHLARAPAGAAGIGAVRVGPFFLAMVIGYLIAW